MPLAVSVSMGPFETGRQSFHLVPKSGTVNGELHTCFPCHYASRDVRWKGVVGYLAGMKVPSLHHYLVSAASIGSICDKSNKTVQKKVTL